ncbi:MAG: hypothetical protein WC455_21345 [Dehalococcoidia bacterium]
MKISELITLLQKEQAEHGDIRVAIYDNEYSEDVYVESVTFIDKPHTFLDSTQESYVQIT